MTDLWYSGCSSSSNQYWRLTHLTTYRGYFRVTNKQTGKCLVNRNSGYYSKPDGWNWDSITPVGNFADQFWYLYRETGEYFMIRSKWTYSCIFQNNDGRLGVAWCNPGYADQWWQVDAVSTFNAVPKLPDGNAPHDYDAPIFKPQSPDANTPHDHGAPAPDFAMFAAASKFYHTNDYAHLIVGVFGVLIMLNLVCIFAYCHGKYSKDVVQYKTVSMTDSEAFESES
eukprot:294490_1